MSDKRSSGMNKMDEWLNTLETLRCDIARSSILDADQEQRLYKFIGHLTEEVARSRHRGASFPVVRPLIDRVSRQHCMQQCADAIRKAEKHAGTTDSSVIITNEYLNIAEMWRKLAALAGGEMMAGHTALPVQRTYVFYASDLVVALGLEGTVVIKVEENGGCFFVTTLENIRD